MNALQIVTRKIEPVMEVQTRVVDYMTRYMVGRGGFKWLLPVMLSSITDPPSGPTPRGGRGPQTA